VELYTGLSGVAPLECQGPFDQFFFMARPDSPKPQSRAGFSTQMKTTRMQELWRTVLP